MKKSTLLFVLATFSIVASAQMKKVLNVQPMVQYSETKDVNFNLASIAELLGTDTETLSKDFNHWLSVPDTIPEYTEEPWLLSVLTDEGKAELKKQGHDRNGLTAEGKIVTIDNYSEAVWFYNVSMSTEMNALTFTLGTMNDISMQEGQGYHVGLALTYNSKTVTFDIDLNLSSANKGNTLSLADMEKVGEKQMELKVVKDEPSITNVPLKDIAHLFGENVSEDMIDYYVMIDGQKQVISDICNYNNYGASASMDAEGVVTDAKNPDTYLVEYIRYGSENIGEDEWKKVFANDLHVSSLSNQYSNGAKALTSVFFVYGNKYYEYVLDVQFGDTNDELNSIDIVDAASISAQLEKTPTFGTYNERFDNEGNSESSDESIMEEGYALIKSAVDIDKIASSLGTDSPVLYAEKTDGGKVVYTSNYSAGPGQGFWFIGTGSNVCAGQFSTESVFGMYYSDGSIKWYENPNTVKAGDNASFNLYFVNTENSKAVKLSVSVEVVEKIQDKTPSYTKVRRLPMSFDELAPTAIDHITVNPTRNAIYDLNGQRLTSPRRGINIVDGKKVLIK